VRSLPCRITVSFHNSLVLIVRRMPILGYIDQTDIKVACTVPRTDFPLQHKSSAHSWGESGIAVVCTLYSRNPEKSVAKNFAKREQASTFSNLSGHQIILFPFVWLFTAL